MTTAHRFLRVLRARHMMLSAYHPFIFAIHTNFRADAGKDDRTLHVDDVELFPSTCCLERRPCVEKPESD